MKFFFWSNATTCPCGLHGPPSWAWQECNRLLSLGRPWGAVTLSRWCVSGDIGGCSARRALKPKFYHSTQTVVTAGILPFRKNFHVRAGNRTRDLMISSQRFWPLGHEAGLTRWSQRTVTAMPMLQAWISSLIQLKNELLTPSAYRWCHVVNWYIVVFVSLGAHRTKMVFTRSYRKKQVKHFALCPYVTEAPKKHMHLGRKRALWYSQIIISV